MTYRYLSIARDHHMATVTFNRPEERNTLNLGLMAEIMSAAEDFRFDEETRVVIFTGSGKDFSCGVDLKDEELAEHLIGDTMLMKNRLFKTGPRMLRRIHEMNQITIAAVNGAALGGGACIAAACDFRIGADDCRIGYPEVGLGMNLSWGALPMCVNLIGPARTKQMVILAKMENAQTLLNWGFLDGVVPAEDLPAEAAKMAEAYAAKPPLAAQMVKQSVNAIASALDQAIMHMDTDQYQLATGSKDFAEGLQAFFEKRKPVFKGD